MTASHNKIRNVTSYFMPICFISSKPQPSYINCWGTCQLLNIGTSMLGSFHLAFQNKIQVSRGEAQWRRNCQPPPQRTHGRSAALRRSHGAEGRQWASTRVSVSPCAPASSMVAVLLSWCFLDVSKIPTADASRLLECCPLLASYRLFLQFPIFCPESYQVIWYDFARSTINWLYIIS